MSTVTADAPRGRVTKAAAAAPAPSDKARRRVKLKTGLELRSDICAIRRESASATKNLSRIKVDVHFFPQIVGGGGQHVVRLALNDGPHRAVARRFESRATAAVV